MSLALAVAVGGLFALSERSYSYSGTSCGSC